MKIKETKNGHFDERWYSIHERQDKPGQCGPGVIYLVLKYSALLDENKGKSVIVPSRAEILKKTNIDWYGVSNDITLAYLSSFFAELGYKKEASLQDIAQHLHAGNIIIVDWMDDDPPPPPEGHYSIVGEYNPHKDELTLIDTSLSGRDIWRCCASQFVNKWYDHIGVHRQPALKLDRFMIWVNPRSLYKKAPNI